jgi:hypothetical protein
MVLFCKHGVLSPDCIMASMLRQLMCASLLLMYFLYGPAVIFVGIFSAVTLQR